ncbi:MAG: aldehyde ferredoxin oxidoreductase family protein [bacterium]|nr:MAG: aldehyde ferredoxin oxidoreductase family protein [bacterium]
MSRDWRILEVDLTTGRAAGSALGGEEVAPFIGGRGLGVRLLAPHAVPGADPLGGTVPLIVTAGPLTGAGVPSGDRFSLSTISPLTGTVMDTNSGGRLGRALKRGGTEVLAVSGRALDPVVLVVGDGELRLHPAGDLWGCSVTETILALRERWGRDAGLAVIGPAGENRVRYASIMTERMRAMGRGGAGAVMGAMNLKALVVKGSGKVPVKDPGRLKVVLEESNRWLRAHPVTSKALPALGTPMLVRICARAGIFPLRNFQAVAQGEDQAYSGEELAARFPVASSGCAGFFIQCGRITEVDGARGEGPEYESLWALGPDLGIEDLARIVRAAHRCNDLGMDTISAGATMACAMELAQRGLRPSSLSFGDAGAAAEMIERIARREGEGDELAEGSLFVARGAGAEAYAMQVKGMELPGYDPRGAQGQGLAYATSNRGGCHLRGGYLIAREILGIPKKVAGSVVLGKGGHVARAQDFGAVADSLSACRFATFALAAEYWSRMVRAVTGWDVGGEDLMTAGQRIVNLERILNLEMGIGPEADTLPPRFTREPLGEGPCAGEVVHLDDLLAEYYAHRGWPGGIPSRSKRKELGLDEERRRILRKTG